MTIDENPGREQTRSRCQRRTKGKRCPPVGVRAGENVDVRLAAFAAGPLVLVGGQVDDSLGVAVIRAPHDSHMCRSRCRAVCYAQRQVIRLRARVDKIGDLQWPDPYVSRPDRRHRR